MVLFAGPGRLMLTNRHLGLRSQSFCHAAYEATRRVRPIPLGPHGSRLLDAAIGHYGSHDWDMAVGEPPSAFPCLGVANHRV